MSARALISRWWQRRSVRRSLAGLALALAALAGLQVYAQSQRWQIDPTAGLKLSEAQRKEFDQIFFEEMTPHSNLSKRYSAADWEQERLRDFERMARAGYVPAQAYMRMVGRNWGVGHADREGYEKLLAAANLGDLSAACALPHFNKWNRGRYVSEAERTRFFLEPMQRGADKGHWGCYDSLGSAHYFGAYGLAEDKKKGYELLLASAREGNRSTISFLAGNLLGQVPFSIARDRVRFCWGAVQAPLDEDVLRRVFVGLYLLRQKPEFVDNAARQAEIQELIDEWVSEISPTRLVHKAATPNECVRLQAELGDISGFLK